MQFPELFFLGFDTIFSIYSLPLIPFVLEAAKSPLKSAPLNLVLGVLFCYVGFGLLVFDSGGRRPFMSSWFVQSSRFGFWFLAPMFLSRSLRDIAQGKLPMIEPSWSLAERASVARFGLFIFGCFLGLVWIPGSGPNVALLIATGKGANFISAFVKVLVLGIGAMAPLLSVGFGARFTREAVGMSLHRGYEFSGLGYFLAMSSWGLLLLNEVRMQLPAWAVLGLPPQWMRLVFRVYAE